VKRLCRANIEVVRFIGDGRTLRDQGFGARVQ
jgi:hypothetical protein